MKRKYSTIIRKIAKQEGVSKEFVYAEIQKAITLGYNNADPKVQAYWRQIAPDGEVPTPEKFIEAMTKIIKKDSKSE